MRSRGWVAVDAAVLSSSLFFAPAPQADALADAFNCLELTSGGQTVRPPDGTSAGGPIWDDGRSVLFASAATNLGVTDANGAVRDVSCATRPHRLRRRRWLLRSFARRVARFSRGHTVSWSAMIGCAVTNAASHPSSHGKRPSASATTSWTNGSWTESVAGQPTGR